MAEGFDLAGRNAVVTGGYGVLGGAMARALADAGARVAVLGRSLEKARRFAASLPDGLGVACDVTDAASISDARDAVVEAFGTVHILVNAAGGNQPSGTVMPDRNPFDLDPEAFRELTDLNLFGTVAPSLSFGQSMTGGGSIINISSVAAETPLSRVGAYGASKAGVEHFTRWLAVEAASRFGETIRVNAVRPGFFVADQNRALLLQEDGSPTQRGRSILEHTPVGRFGRPEDLAGAVVWLASNASSFVTGSVVAVDGGFGAQRGV